MAEDLEDSQRTKLGEPVIIHTSKRISRGREGSAASFPRVGARLCKGRGSSSRDIELRARLTRFFSLSSNFTTACQPFPAVILTFLLCGFELFELGSGSSTSPSSLTGVAGGGVETSLTSVFCRVKAGVDVDSSSDISVSVRLTAEAISVSVGLIDLNEL